MKAKILEIRRIDSKELMKENFAEDLIQELRESFLARHFDKFYHSIRGQLVRVLPKKTQLNLARSYALRQHYYNPALGHSFGVPKPDEKTKQALDKVSRIYAENVLKYKPPQEKVPRENGI